MLQKKITLVTALVVILMLGAGLVLAEDKDGKEKKMTGKELFKSHCKGCHSEDSDAGEYTPMSLIMEQWDEFFDDMWTETHGQVACPEVEGKMVTDMFDKDTLKMIHKFCVDHAADSEQPMTCG